MLRKLLPLLAIFLVGNCCAQQFSYITNAQGISVQSGYSEYGHGVSFYDFNQDGLDDLTIGTDGLGIYLYVNINGNFTLQQVLGSAHDTKQVVWADFDRDGDLDLLVTNDFGPIMLFECNDAGQLVNIAPEVGLTQTNTARTFGASWGDYNKDGWIDLYVCNYTLNESPTNWLFKNNGGTFTDVTAVAGVGDGFKPSFQAVWADINNDSWPDLYVVNDKAPTNGLYLNNGDGTFTDISVSSGANISVDGMNNSVADIDHDGDLDFYVANNASGNSLLRNNGDNTFTDITTSAGLSVNRFCWGSLWIDYDNDADQDIFVSTSTPVLNNQNPFYRNDGNETWSQHQAVFATPNQVLSYSPTKGDYNNDGYYDMLIGNGSPNANGLWRNSGGANNYFKLTLEGTVSNFDGIGCWIEYSFDDEHRAAYTASGENYLGQNSQHMIFGFNQAEKAKDFVVHWPSGWNDSIPSINPGTHLTIQEGSTYSAHISGTTFEACYDSSVILNAGEHDTYLWSNGSTEQYLEVTQTGYYSVQTTIGALSSTSDPIFCIIYPQPEFPFSIIEPLCHDSSDGSIEVSGAAAVLWEDGSTTNGLENITGGDFACQLTDKHGCISDTVIHVVAPLPVEYIASIANLSCFGSMDGEISLIISGGSGDYTVSPSELTNLSSGDTFFTITDQQGCTVSASEFIYQPDVLEVDLTLTPVDEISNGSATATISGGTPPYLIFWSTGSTATSISNLAIGTYTLSILDANGCNSSQTFEIETADNIASILETQIFFNAMTNEVNGPGFFMLEVYNSAGQLMIRCEANGKTVLSDLPHGIYLLVVEKNSERCIKKVAIQ